MFDPTKPANGSQLISAEMRGQLNGLKALIDALLTVNAAQVDAVTTLNPGDPASVSLSVIGTTLHFSFAIPQGSDGIQGPVGNDGAPFTNFVVDGVSTLNPTDPATVAASFDGSAVRMVFGIPRGNDGYSSPPITSFLVDGVNTLNPGDNATVQTSFDGANVRLLFGIPRGNDGGAGDPGPQGPPFANAMVDGVTTLTPGDPATVTTSFDGSNVHFTFSIPQGTAGAQGTPGEVSNAQLTSAIATTAQNPGGVQPLALTFSDPPTAGELTQVQDKLNELLTALQRP